MNITKISRYCGFFTLLLLLAVVLPTADAQDFDHFELGPKPPNIVPDGWIGNRGNRDVRTTENSTVWMPDANLRAAVEAELDALNPRLTLTKANLTVLRSIDANGQDKSPITNLTGLEHATNLTWLDLRVNNITSLTPLSGLTNLINLDLSENNITSLTSLSGLVNLERLDLALNSSNAVSINDVSDLSSMINMEVLNLAGNNVDDISDLSQMTSLTNLYLGSNSVSDISILSNFSDLESLSIYNNNYDPIAALDALDISGLADLTQLNFLQLGRNEIDDISDLSDLTQLRSLYLEGNNISDISILSDFTNLETLQLESNDLDNDDISNLSDLTQLNFLALSLNNITDISHLSDMVNLEYLSLSRNNITDISHLSDMTNLEKLFLQWTNTITDISHLFNMINLEELHLTGNSIPTIGVLVELNSLEKVDLMVNPVEDIRTNRDTLATLYARSVEVLIDDLVLPTGQGRPEPGISFDIPSDPQNGPFDVSVVFTEEVYGFEQTELVLDPTTIASITSEAFTITDKIRYTATITPTNSGILTFSVAAGVARDAAYNLNTAATSEPVTIDKIVPRVSITVPTRTQNAPFDVSVVFTEEVSDFVQGDLTLGGTGTANITDFDTTDKTTYTVEVTPVIDGDITFSVAAGVATDTAGNENTATTTTQTVTVDAVEPRVSITVPSGTQNAPFEVSVVFTEVVSGFDENDLELSGTPATITNWTPDPTNAMRYVAIVTPTNTTPGDVTIDVPAGVATNAIGTPNNAATTQTVPADLPPNVSITVPSGTQNAPFEVSVVFTEEVYGFEQTELVLDPTTIASITSEAFTTTDNITYTATITPTIDGNITFSVDAGVAIDAANNENTATTTTQTVTVDVAPGVSITVPTGTQDAPFDVSVVFTEEVSDFVQGDLTLGGTGTANITDFDTTDKTTYTVEITPVIDGDITFSVAAGVATDTADNENTATTTTQTVTVDAVEPEVSVTVPSGTQNARFQVTFTFTEPVSEFNASDITLGGLSAEITEPQQDSTDEKVYTAAITPTNTTPGSITIDVPAGVATNAIGTPNNAATTQTVPVDLPPNVSITVPSGTQNAPFEVSVVFTDIVLGFDKNDLILSGTPATITELTQDSTNQKRYVTIVTPTNTTPGNISIDIPTGVTTDAAGNENTAATTQTASVDLPPNVSLTVPADTQNSPFNVSVVFTEEVSDFELTELGLEPSTIASITSEAFTTTDNNTTYTATITPTDSGTLTFSVDAGVAIDTASNENTPATSQTVTIDIDAPRVSITVPSGTQNAPFDVSVIFTEKVSGFELTELGLEPSTIASITSEAFTTTDNNTTYTATITPTDSGTLTFSVDAGVAIDTAGNENTPATSQTVTIDIDAPRVSITVPSGTQNAPFDVSVIFTEKVSGFELTELGLEPSTIASITSEAFTTTDNITYTATITPTNSGTLTFSVNAGVATDTASNENTAATSQTVTIDTGVPGVSITVPSGTQNAPFDVSVIFTEKVLDFELTELDLEPSTIASITSEAFTTTDNITFTATVTPTDSGTLTFSVDAGVAIDTAGNENTAGTSQTVTIDTDAPRVSITVPSGTQNSPFNVSVVFTEPVSDFEQTELGLEPSTIASITSEAFTTTDNITTYTATITPTNSGTLTFSVDAGVAIDTAGNENTAGTSQTVTIDIDAPRVSITVPSGTQNSPFNVSVVFTEEVSDFVQGDLTLGGTGTANITDFDATDAPTYTVEITPVIDGDITFSVAARVATDAANNENTAATTQTVPVNVLEPQVSVTVPAGVQNAPFEVSVVFTEVVSGFDENDLELSGTPATITNWTPDPTNVMRYVAIVTPTNTTPGDVTIDVPAGAVTNDIGTPNDAATTQTVAIDLPPNVSITVTSNVQNGPFQVSVIFTEAVSGFYRDILSLGGSAMARITGLTTEDNTSYIVDITPRKSGDVTLQVAAGVATDAGKNRNNASQQQTITVEFVVVIPDANLAAGLRSALDLSEDASITDTQMESLTVFRYNGSTLPDSEHIGDLTGLGYATNLQTLSLRGNQISDLMPIHALENLTSLALSGNRLVSTNFITHFTSLETLLLSNNSIREISGLEDLIALTVLNIKSNPIVDNKANRQTREALQQRTGLNLKIARFITDNGRPAVEISVPAGVQNDAFQAIVTFTESVSSFESSDIELDGIAAEVTLLKEDGDDPGRYVAMITPTDTVLGEITLDLPENVVTNDKGNGNTAATPQTATADLPPNVTLEVLPDAQSSAFDVSVVFSEEVSGFEQTELVLNPTSIAEITAFTTTDDITYTTTITPTSSGDVTFSVAAGVAIDAANQPNKAAEDMTVTVGDLVIYIADANLKAKLYEVLTIAPTDNITESQMATLTSLHILQSSRPNRITDITGLEYATNLQSLNIRGHRITDIRILDNLTNLTTLKLRGNLVSDISVLENLTNLTMLDLKNNEITDISALSELTVLRRLHIQGNDILDTSPLHSLLRSNGGELLVDIDVSEYPPWDVNEDGVVDSVDLSLVTLAIGQSGDDIVNARTDVDGNGVVDSNDTLLVSSNFSSGGPLSPSADAQQDGLISLLDPSALQNLDQDALQAQLQILLAESDGSAKYRRIIEMLQQLLAAITPEETILLANYPNPFNPETWIPYRLAHASSVRISIYDTRGVVVRHLDLGHQPEGYYTSRSRAAYWDGRNSIGERVASGVYFYQLEADHLSLLRKMVILK